MLKSPFAEYVPLPEVGEHTDRITIGQLGLPEGFDESALLLNVRGMERAATVAGLSHVTISGGEGKQDEELFTSIGAHSDGSIAAGGLGMVRRAPLYSPTPSPIANTTPNRYYRPKELRVNTTAINARIQADGDRWKRGPFNPSAQARYINRGLQSAVWRAGIESHRPRMIDTGLVSIGLGGIYVADESFSRVMDLPSSTANTTAFLCVALCTATLHLAERHFDKKESGEELPPRIVYAIPGIAIDRLPLSGIMAYTTRMVRAAKQPAKS